MKKAIMSLIVICIIVMSLGCDLLGAGWFLPDFIGSWAIEEEETDPYPITTRTIWTFAREEWEMWYQMKDDDDVWQNVAAYRGTLTSEDSAITMTLTLEKIADPETWIIADDTEWTAVQDADAGPGGSVSWAVDNDTLTITYPDGEKTVLTRYTETEE